MLLLCLNTAKRVLQKNPKNHDCTKHYDGSRGGMEVVGFKPYKLNVGKVLIPLISNFSVYIFIKFKRSLKQNKTKLGNLDRYNNYK